jgi:hypothetical protein
MKVIRGLFQAVRLLVALAVMGLVLVKLSLVAFGPGAVEVARQGAAERARIRQEVRARQQERNEREIERIQRKALEDFRGAKRPLSLDDLAREAARKVP